MVSSPSIILFLYSNQVKNCDLFNSAKKYYKCKYNSLGSTL